MSSGDYEIECSFHVYDNKTGKKITVKECPDIPGNVLICTESTNDRKYFGDIWITIESEFASKLSEAIKLQIETGEKLR